MVSKKLLIEDKNSKSFKALPVSNWKPLGPFTYAVTGSWSPGQDRINVIDVDSSNEKNIYVGAPAGRILKSTGGRSTWTPLSDQLPQIRVSGIAVDHTNSNIIYIATVDKDGLNTLSIGVLKSTYGGKNWNTTGLTFALESFDIDQTTGDIIMNPKNNNYYGFMQNGQELYTIND
jgi:hypothetical protein